MLAAVAARAALPHFTPTSVVGWPAVVTLRLTLGAPIERGVEPSVHVGLSAVGLRIEIRQLQRGIPKKCRHIAGQMLRAGQFDQAMARVAHAATGSGNATASATTASATTASATTARAGARRTQVTVTQITPPI